MMKGREAVEYGRFLKNQFLQVVVYDPEQGKLSLKSRFLVEKEDGEIELSWPKTPEQLKYFFRGVRFAVVQGILQGKVVSFKVEITADVLADFDSGVMSLSLPKYWDKIEQKRKYQRVSRQVPLKFRQEVSEGFSELLLEGDSHDISVGGMEISTTEALEDGSLIELFFTLEYFDFTGILGRVLRSREDQSTGNLLYYYSIEFLGMFERERDTLNQLLMRSLPALPAPRLKLESQGS